MTKEELKQKAEGYCNTKLLFTFETDLVQKIVKMFAKQAYIAGATENGIQWHDLRKNPNDLPKDCYDVLDEAGYKVFYHHKEGVWKNASGSKIVKVIAWCEIPQFKE